MGAITNVVVVGLGGQGVLTLSDILADAAFMSGHDVKKSEIHGMAQRGGTVTSDLRYGDNVLSPMVSVGEADYVVVLDDSQVEFACVWKKNNGVLISPSLVCDVTLPSKRSINVALLGRLSPYLLLPVAAIEDSLVAHLKPDLQVESLQLFRRMAHQTRSFS
jgi:indolepyruvate ferredoxin oxidoreductase beta subunit